MYKKALIEEYMKTADQYLAEELKTVLFNPTAQAGSIRIHLSLFGEYPTILSDTEDFTDVELHKKAYYNKLSNLLVRKTNGAYRIVIDKPNMDLDAVPTQVKLYKDKYASAIAGEDVFKGQALAKGISEADFRESVIQKGDEFLQLQKKIDDTIETTRTLMEENIFAIDETIDSIGEMINLFAQIDSFTLVTPIEEIVEALKL